MSKADEEAQKILGYYRQMDEVSKMIFVEFVYALGRRQYSP